LQGLSAQKPHNHWPVIGLLRWLKILECGCQRLLMSETFCYRIMHRIHSPCYYTGLALCLRFNLYDCLLLYFCGAIYPLN
jgi:hypothetical protein